MIEPLESMVARLEYPGRGIVLGLHEDGVCAIAAYFIMGRSEGSRNRVFLETGTGVRTRAFDESILADPSLYVYAPVLALDGRLIVTNGDQTDTIAAHLKNGGSFQTALRTRTYEPDSLRTPRINGLMAMDAGQLSYQLSILKCIDARSEACGRFFFEYDQPIPGIGHYIHTYSGDGAIVAAFEGEPRSVSLNGELDEFTDRLWRGLNAGNRVSLYVRFSDLISGEARCRIINKYMEG